MTREQEQKVRGMRQRLLVLRAEARKLAEQLESTQGGSDLSGAVALTTAADRAGDAAAELADLL